jgi:hypothetical protein
MFCVSIVSLVGLKNFKWYCKSFNLIKIMGILSIKFCHFARPEGEHQPWLSFRPRQSIVSRPAGTRYAQTACRASQNAPVRPAHYTGLAETMIKARESMEA